MTLMLILISFRYLVRNISGGLTASIRWTTTTTKRVKSNWILNKLRKKGSILSLNLIGERKEEDKNDCTENWLVTTDSINEESERRLALRRGVENSANNVIISYKNKWKIYRFLSENGKCWVINQWQLKVWGKIIQNK